MTCTCNPARTFTWVDEDCPTHGREAEDEDPCSDACTRMVCEWCPEYDRQAALVEQFKRELDTLGEP